MSDSLDYLFVYGTLRSDAFSASHRQLITTDFSLVSPATMRGKLYAIGDYPGMVEAQEATDIVTGEVYSFDKGHNTLALIDDYEGCGPKSTKPHLYTRMRKKAHLRDGSSVGAWMYQYNFPVDDSMLIRSGDFLDPI
ncbi:MAG: gamma-glutamylcyclotransferase family protein [Gammaproteobacteria bacterium]